MKAFIEKFYDKIFADEEREEEVPYANKKFMFYFTIILSTIVLVLIVKDIVENIQEAGI